MWLRHDLQRFANRLKALEARLAQEPGHVLTESQVRAMEKAKQEKEAHGEIETAHPGYLGGHQQYLKRGHPRHSLPHISIKASLAARYTADCTPALMNSEIELKGKLPLSGRVSLRGYLSEINRVADICIWASELNAIESVEHLEAELKVYLLVNRGSLQDA